MDGQRSERLFRVGKDQAHRADGQVAIAMKQQGVRCAMVEAVALHPVGVARLELVLDAIDLIAQPVGLLAQRRGIGDLHPERRQKRVVKSPGNTPHALIPVHAPVPGSPHR